MPPLPRLLACASRSSSGQKGFVVLPRRRVVERTFSWFGRNPTTNDLPPEEERPKLKQLPAGRFEAALRLERRITRDGISRPARSLPFTHPEWQPTNRRAPPSIRRRLAASGPQPDAAQRSAGRAGIASPVTSQTPVAVTALCSSFKRSVAFGNNCRVRHAELYSTLAGLNTYERAPCRASVEGA